MLVFVLPCSASTSTCRAARPSPPPSPSANYQNTTVYYSDGKTPLGTIGATNRQDLTYSQIPSTCRTPCWRPRTALLDRGRHLADRHPARRQPRRDGSGGNLNGGSTITQEFVRNYYDGVGTQQTASRKVKEIFIAQKLATTSPSSGS